ncbi:hypothetical protein [Altererythrobacter sp. MF3-039]|uniref:hypothetical protein n=1 Tax=Altererythrobacter sp. MF3-039 TaxID=3252901 RepID=UPI00390CBE8A
MVIPRLGADGVRQTVNANLTPAQMTWNLRSALNVAALNCLDMRHAGILPNYKTFLEAHSRDLRTTNRALADEFRKKHGSGYRDVQDSYMTQVYNYFALPPVQDAYCDMALTVSNELALVPKGELGTFSAMALQRIEGVFEDFFSSYEQYRVDLAAWDARYAGTVPGPTTSRYRTYLDAAGTSSASVQPVETVQVAPSTAAPAALDGPIVQAAPSGLAVEVEAATDTPVNTGDVFGPTLTEE